MQHGATVADLILPIASCTLCGACEPVCPEEIDLVGMILDLRSQALHEDVPWQATAGELQAQMQSRVPRQSAVLKSGAIFVTGKTLREPVLTRVQAWLGCMIAADNGADIALALETGIPVPDARREQFLAPLHTAEAIVVADGLLLRHLRDWLAQKNPISLGEALSMRPAIRRGLRASDLYVIEPRAYHQDYQRLVKYYDRLRAETGCLFNLDLQRIAVPATAQNLLQRLGLAGTDDRAQTQWLLKGRRVERIVVESANDIAAFGAVTRMPVVHLADLVDD
jgi:ferredoxin